MPLTPAEIIHRRFKRGLLGYSPKQVNAFLREVSETVRQLMENNMTLRDECERLREQLSTYTTIEQQLRDALVVAEKTADEVKRLAQKEAELIIAQAKQEAERLKTEAQEQVRQAFNEFERLRQERTRMEVQTRQLLQSLLELLNRQGLPETPSGQS